jgi:hypothetical protein
MEHLYDSAPHFPRNSSNTRQIHKYKYKTHTQKQRSYLSNSDNKVDLIPIV